VPKPGYGLQSIDVVSATTLTVFEGVDRYFPLCRRPPPRLDISISGRKTDYFMFLRRIGFMDSFYTLLALYATAFDADVIAFSVANILSIASACASALRR
jgi:hypothetical protein